MGPAATAKTGRQGEESPAGSTQCVLSYIGAGELTLPTALWEDTRGSCLGGLQGLSQASPLADANPCPLPTANRDSENRALMGGGGLPGGCPTRGDLGDLGLAGGVSTEGRVCPGLPPTLRLANSQRASLMAQW